ncbi:unnamed protein product [Acanthoscelides obtectus]|uniref:PiggyBac transposable element-derived protein domain-containing protein n=1 Tax=Acanthoscelides obtectus TaxID=200917 RepID=A0A9P0KFK6_ACAOB|nr:unnamed protein product [Acanthoscelides obtectus]CAK1640925.1 PiggyBac transposable element-derived protein 3 [Acanthoscelides obtectus]
MDNYSYWNYWKRPMKLHELMAEIENIDDDEFIPDTIAVLPPVNANEYNTDEDSGDENEVDINNLPGSQLMTEVEVVFENKGSNQTTVESDFDSDDDLPLSTFLTKKRPKLSKPSYSWKKGDINQDFPEWVNASGQKNSLSPLELFFQFIDDEIIDLVVKYSNMLFSIIAEGLVLYFSLLILFSLNVKKLLSISFVTIFVTSLPLLAELSSRGLKCTGTLRENRLSDCPLEKSSMFKKKSRFSFDYLLEENQNNIVCKWNDNSVVTIASNVTSPFPTQQVKRFSQKEKKMIHVEQSMFDQTMQRKHGRC